MQNKSPVLEKCDALRKDMSLSNLFRLTCSWEGVSAALYLDNGKEVSISYSEYRRRTMAYAAYLINRFGGGNKEKFAAIGTNTNTYTLEDLIVNSDQDYEDIVFKAVGLEATGAFANVIDDPYAYYTANGRWNQTTQGGGGQTLGEALIQVGVVDASTVPR